MNASQQKKIINYKMLNRSVQKGQILFTGSSLMEEFPVVELCATAGIGKIVYNRGVSGFNSDQMVSELDTMLFDLEPSKIFINIGTNDMCRRTDGKDWFAHLVENYEYILSQIRERLPQTKVYLMAFYPVCPSAAEDVWVKEALKIRTKDNLRKVNEKLQELAEAYGYHFIDANDGLTDEAGYQKKEFAEDGIHMYASAYQVVFENIQKYI